MDRFVADKSAHSNASAEDSPLDVSRRGLLIGAGAAAILGAQVTSAAAQMGSAARGLWRCWHGAAQGDVSHHL